jgi:hypothetical protein
LVVLRAWQSSSMAAVCLGAGSGSSRMCRVLWSGMMSPEPARAVRVRVCGVGSLFAV